MSTIRHAKEMVISTKALNFISSKVRIIALSVFWGAQMPNSFTTQILPSDQQHQCHFPDFCSQFFLEGPQTAGLVFNGVIVDMTEE